MAHALPSGLCSAVHSLCCARLDCSRQSAEPRTVLVQCYAGRLSNDCKCMNAIVTGTMPLYRYPWHWLDFFSDDCITPPVPAPNNRKEMLPVSSTAAVHLHTSVMVVVSSYHECSYMYCLILIQCTAMPSVW